MLGRQRQAHWWKPQRLSLTLCDTLFPWEQHFTLIVWMGKKHKDGFLGFSILASDLTFRYCCLCNHLFLFTWWKKKILSNSKWGRSGKKCVGILMYEHRRVMSPTWFSAWSVRLISYQRKPTVAALQHLTSFIFALCLLSVLRFPHKSQSTVFHFGFKDTLKIFILLLCEHGFPVPDFTWIVGREQSRGTNFDCSMNHTKKKKPFFFLEISCNHLNNKANVAHVATPRSL